MRLPDYLFTPDQQLQQSYLDNYSPGFMEMSGRAFDDSFGTSSLGLLNSIAEMEKAKNTGIPLVEEEWRASSDYRPGLEYKGGMTDSAAKLLAKRYDQAKQTEYLMDRSGALAWFGYATGTIMGAIPDPVNLIPFGAVLKGRYLLKLGKMATRVHKAANKHTEKALGRIVMSGAEGGLGAAALQPAIAYERGKYQEQWDAKSASLDILAGVGAGMFFGTAVEGGRALLGRRKLEIVGDPTDPDAVITTRAASEPPIRDRITEELTPSEMAAAARHAVQRFDNGEDADVASVIGDKAGDGTETRAGSEEATPAGMADEEKEFSVPAGKYNVVDQEGKFISGHDSYKESWISTGSKLFNKLKSGVWEHIDPKTGDALYIGTVKDLMNEGYEDTFQPKQKPKYTRAQPEPETDLNKPKAQESEIDQETALTDQEYQNQINEKPETAEETAVIQAAEQEGASHAEAAEIIEEAANCVLKTSAAV